jgi:hypothetical protein
VDASANSALSPVLTFAMYFALSESYIKFAKLKAFSEIVNKCECGVVWKICTLRKEQKNFVKVQKLFKLLSGLP